MLICDTQAGNVDTLRMTGGNVVEERRSGRDKIVCGGYSSEMTIVQKSTKKLLPAQSLMALEGGPLQARRYDPGQGS
jgi:hypothetical protein